MSVQSFSFADSTYYFFEVLVVVASRALWHFKVAIDKGSATTLRIRIICPQFQILR